jgi:hypothetical protein
VGLNRTQKRLLWLFKTYGERDPITALYTWTVATHRWATWGGVNSAPSLAGIFRMAGMLPSGESQFAPGPEATVGEHINWALGYAQVRSEREGWRDTACAKLIPVWARWIAAAFKEKGWPGRIAEWWDTPVSKLGGDGGPLHNAPSPVFLSEMNELLGSVQYLCDWYLGARPDLGRFPTYESAIQAAYEWHDSLERKAIAGSIEKGPVVYEWPDGWTVQELTNREMFVQEGHHLGHCIAGGEYLDAMVRGTSRYFSLRRPSGEPWVTIEVDSPETRHSHHTGALVQQIKGCKNRMPGTPPDPTECTRVFDFLAAAGDWWELGGDYAACWGYTAASLGLPEKVQRRDPSGFSVVSLVRPPPRGLEVGHATDRLNATWWRPDAD